MKEIKVELELQNVGEIEDYLIAAIKYFSNQATRHEEIFSVGKKNIEVLTTALFDAAQIILERNKNELSPLEQLREQLKEQLQEAILDNSPEEPIQ